MSSCRFMKHQRLGLRPSFDHLRGSPSLDCQSTTHQRLGLRPSFDPLRGSPYLDCQIKKLQRIGLRPSFDPLRGWISILGLSIRKAPTPRASPVVWSPSGTFIPGVFILIVVVILSIASWFCPHRENRSKKR